MIQVIKSDAREKVDLGWLNSRLSFSFGNYFDPNNTAFSVLRVCNDDIIAAGKGFGAHPHSDMEIVTVVLSGAIRHEDNLGNSEIISAGEVQRMSAGSGIVHAEYNASETDQLRLLQLWFLPNEKGLQPSFETSGYTREQVKNALYPIVNPIGLKQTAKIHQDLTIYLSRLEQKQSIQFEQAAGRNAYLFVMEGCIHVNVDTILEAGDTARIESIPRLNLAAQTDSFLMLIDLP